MSLGFAYACTYTVMQQRFRRLRFLPTTPVWSLRGLTPRKASATPQRQLTRRLFATIANLQLSSTIQAQFPIALFGNLCSPLREAFAPPVFSLTWRQPHDTTRSSHENSLALTQTLHNHGEPTSPIPPVL